MELESSDALLRLNVVRRTLYGPNDKRNIFRVNRRRKQGPEDRIEWIHYPCELTWFITSKVSTPIPSRFTKESSTFFRSEVNDILDRCLTVRVSLRIRSDHPSQTDEDRRTVKRLPPEEKGKWGHSLGTALKRVRRSSPKLLVTEVTSTTPTHLVVYKTPRVPGKRWFGTGQSGRKRAQGVWEEGLVLLWLPKEVRRGQGLVEEMD